MITDIFKLKKNSWHLKLMNWIWGFDHNNFRNMCPYFWLSIFNIIFLIPIGSVKLFVDFCKWFMVHVNDWFNAYTNYCEEKEEIWHKKMLEKFQEELNSGKTSFLEKFYLYHIDKINLSKKYRTFWWNNVPVSTKEKIINLVSGKVKDRINIEAQRTYTKEQRIAKLAVNIKRGAKIVSYFLVLGLLYLVYMLAKLLISLNWVKIWSTFLYLLMKVGLYTGMILGALIIFIGLILLIRYLWCAFGNYCIPCEENRNKFGNGFKSGFKIIFLPFVWLIKGLITFIDLIIALKKNNCPGIDWED